MTYYGWLKGKPIRGKNEKKVRTALRTMLVLLTDDEAPWPQPEVIAMSPDERYDKLVAAIELLNTPTEEE